jgi:hypothetical protein
MCLVSRLVSFALYTFQLPEIRARSPRAFGLFPCSAPLTELRVFKAFKICKIWCSPVGLGRDRAFNISVDDVLMITF